MKSSSRDHAQTTGSALDKEWGRGPMYFSDAIHFIDLILPLARGYASLNRVGSNLDYIREAEAYVNEARHFLSETGDFHSSAEQVAGASSRDEP